MLYNGQPFAFHIHVAFAGNLDTRKLILSYLSENCSNIKDPDFGKNKLKKPITTSHPLGVGLSIRIMVFLITFPE